MMYPAVICRHYDVDWLDSHTCNCRDCGRQGHWMEEGFVVWVKGVSSLTSSAKERAWMASAANMDYLRH